MAGARPTRFPLIGWVCITLCLGAAPAHAVPAAPAQAEAPRTYYLFSLPDAEISEVASAVLGEALTYPYDIDAAVTGKMSFRVSEALSEAELLERLATALETRGVALVRTDGALRLAPLDTALAERPALDIVGRAAPPPPPVLIPKAVPSNAIIEPASADGDTGGGMGWAFALLAALALGGLALLLGRRTRVVEILRRRIGAPTPVPSHRGSRDEVIDALLATQPVSLADLAGACDMAAAQGRPVEQVLRQQGAITDEALAQTYATVSGLALWDRTAQPPIGPPPGLENLTTVLAATRMALVAADDWSVTVATADPFDDEAFNRLCRSSRRMVTLVVARWSDLNGGRPVKGAANDDSVNTGVDPLGPLHIRMKSIGRPAARDGAALLQDILARKQAG